MPSGPELRLPYGPGWEDPDWTPDAPPAVEEAPRAASPDARPRVSTLAQFMSVVKRMSAPWAPRPALPVAPVAKRPLAAGTATYVGQTRRWVIAGGAGLLAISTMPTLPRDVRAQTAQGEAGEDQEAGQGASRRRQA